MESLPSNRTLTNTEVSIRGWGNYCECLDHAACGIMSTLWLCILKAIEHFKQVLVGHTKRSMGYGRAEGDLDYGVIAQ